MRSSFMPRRGVLQHLHKAWPSRCWWMGVVVREEVWWVWGVVLVRVTTGTSRCVVVVTSARRCVGLCPPSH